MIMRSVSLQLLFAVLMRKEQKYDLTLLAITTKFFKTPCGHVQVQMGKRNLRNDALK